MEERRGEWSKVGRGSLSFVFDGSDASFLQGLYRVCVTATESARLQVCVPMVYSRAFLSFLSCFFGFFAQEERFQRTNESINSRVVWFSVLQLLLLCGTTLLSVFYLIRYFHSQKII